MVIETFVVRYGFAAILLGAGLEGEFAVVAGGVAAQHGLLPLWQAMFASAVGSCIADQVWFQLGRRLRDRRWIAQLRRRKVYASALRLLELRPNAFILGFRFVYGLRTVSPLIIGTSYVAWAKFALLNVVAAAMWGPLFTLVGYLLGAAVEPIIKRIASTGGAIALVALLIAFIGTQFLRGRRRRSARSE